MDGPRELTPQYSALHCIAR